MKKLSVLLTLLLLFCLTVPTFANGWNDGSYDAWSNAGSRSIQYAKVYIRDGKIVAVDVREYTDRLVEKDWSTYSYEDAVKAAKTIGVAFVEKQSAHVDIISGATSSSKGWIQAVERALIKASDEKPDQKYFDGTFLGRSAVTSRQYYEVVWVTLRDDKITDIKVQRVQPDHSILDPDDYNWPLEAARDEYAKRAIENNTANVDTISNATSLTENLNIAVQDALDRARIR